MALDIFFVFLCVGLALLTIQAPKYFHGVGTTENRTASIDGLRGLLAFFVFLHHSVIWQQYAKTGQWRLPNQLFTHFGQISVMLFFMITAFLFTGKVIRSKTKPIDWLQLFVGRVLRLSPLYIVCVIFLALVVCLLSGFTLKEPAIPLLAKSVRWILFTIPGAPDLNGVTNTRYIMAGVTWTLVYEWIFYLLLPTIALVLSRQVSLIACLLTFSVAAVLIFIKRDAILLMPFLLGMVAAAVANRPDLKAFANTKMATLLVLALFLTTATFFKHAHQAAPILLIGAAFVLIAAGNSLQGLLVNKTTRMLGECAYGIYLTHGLILYLAYHFVVGKENAAAYQPWQHWILVAICSPILIIVSYASFRWIEAPAMRATPTIMHRLRSKRTHATSPASNVVKP